MTEVAGGDDLARGATIGRYTIIRRIGSGGMGVVYLAFDPELDRRVAVKLLQTGGAGSESEGPARLVREAQVMAKLSHPNVITVFDVGTYERDVFVAMEYVKGATLREWWTRERRSAKETIAICVQAGRGIAAAHEQGVLHRDLKPENILVDEHGRARVLDFGLARSKGDEQSTTGEFELDDTLVGRRSSVSLPETQTGAMVGTPAYMAPEQLRARPIDARSDQYAFCITTFEALYGSRPFPGENVAELLSAMEKQKPVLRAGITVPRSVVPVLVKGLSFDPAARWASMGELLDALERAARSDGRRTTALVVVLGVLLAVTGLVVSFTRAPRAAVCANIDQALAGVWDARAHDEVTASFRATGNASSESLLPRVTKALDDYAAGWVGMSTESCTATRVRGVQSDEALDLRAGCLHQRLEDLRAVTELVRHADSALVDNALASALRLRPLAACADVRALRAAYAPVSEDKRVAVDSLQHDVANVVARHNAERCPEAMPLATEVTKRARAVGYVPVRAEALYWAGRVEQLCGDPKTSSDYLFEAASDSEASHQDELAAESLITLAVVVGSGQSHYEEGTSIARLAEGAVRRLGSPDALLSYLAQSRGWIEYTHGNLESALGFRREALDRHRRAVGDDDPDALRAHSDLADLEFEAGHFAQALAAQRDLFEKSSKLIGPNAMRTGRYADDVAETLAAQGKYAEAAPWLERGRGIVTAGALEHERFVEAVEHIGLGEIDRGVSELRAIIALGEEENGRTDPYPLSTRGDLAKWLTVHGRAAGADEAAKVIDEIERLKDKDNPWYANAYAARAIGLARAGKADDAADAAARRAVSLAEHVGSQLPYALLARGEVAIARGDGAGAKEALDRARKLVAERGGIDPTIQRDLDAAAARAGAMADAH